jgi:hypothetical protein
MPGRSEDVERVVTHARIRFAALFALIVGALSGFSVLGALSGGSPDPRLTIIAVATGPAFGAGVWWYYHPQVKFIVDLLRAVMPGKSRVADSRGIPCVVFDNGVILRVGGGGPGTSPSGASWPSYSVWLFLDAGRAPVIPDARAAIRWTVGMNRPRLASSAHFYRMPSGLMEEVAKLWESYRAAAAFLSVHARSPTRRAPDVPPADAVICFWATRRFPQAQLLISDMDSIRQLLERAANTVFPANP